LENLVLTVSSPPHIYGSETAAKRMRDVLVALSPTCVLSIYNYGSPAFLTISIAIITAVISEYLFQKIMGKKVTISDCSALITGLLLAFNLPPEAPYWLPAIGGVFAIVAVKQLFGGLGSNFLNPALAARAFLLASFPVHMNNWTFSDASATSTVLAQAKAYPMMLANFDGYAELLFMKTGGCIGEVSALALIAGGLYLIARRVINWRVPVFYIGSFMLFASVFGRESFFTGNIIFEVLSGGLMLGAFFMATDYATSPITPNGKIVMGVGCGFLTVMIRYYSGYPEGVSYAILIMNLFVPLIDKYVRPRVYGKARRR